LINDAVRHFSCTEVEIELRATDGQLEINTACHSSAPKFAIPLASGRRVNRLILPKYAAT